MLSAKSCTDPAQAPMRAPPPAKRPALRSRRGTTRRSRQSAEAKDHRGSYYRPEEGAKHLAGRTRRVENEASEGLERCGADRQRQDRGCRNRETRPGAFQAGDQDGDRAVCVRAANKHHDGDRRCQLLAPGAGGRSAIGGQQSCTVWDPGSTGHASRECRASRVFESWRN
jgi:hypothetical protein